MNTKLKKPLKDILNQWDFIGVYSIKSWPKDEYDCLIGPIISRINTNVSKKDLKGYLIKELNEHFGIRNTQIKEIEDVVEKNYCLVE